MIENKTSKRLSSLLLMVCMIISVLAVFPLRVNAADSVTPVLAAADLHSLALGDGTVWAWGYNTFGELGAGTDSQYSTPIKVGLSDVIAISTFTKHSLALKSDGTVWAWGRGSYGQLGDGASTQRNTPVRVSDLSDIVAISAGSWHSLALKSDGTVWAWGQNEYGQLGDGTTTRSSTPVQVLTSEGAGFNSVTAISSGYDHSLALKSDGTVWAWGTNSFYQLGEGTNVEYRDTPVQVLTSEGAGFNSVTAISSGNGHSLALKSDGTVWAWGTNSFGVLGDGTTTERHNPVKVSGLSDVAAISTNGQHDFALKSDGTVWAWGRNEYGQLGDGTTTERHSPVKVSGLSDVAAISCGWDHCLALKNDGTVWAWGYNSAGQLGDGTRTDRSTPVQVTGLLLPVPSANTNTPTVTPDEGCWDNHLIGWLLILFVVVAVVGLVVMVVLRIKRRSNGSANG